MNFEIPTAINIRPKEGKYQLIPELEHAIEMALLFDQPLLITGEPGTGKTLLAYHVAQELYNQTHVDGYAKTYRFAKAPLVFNTKTTSVARDLFYTYDAVSHFQASNIAKEEMDANDDENPKRVTKDFIELQALGEAIARANPKDEYADKFLWDATTQPQSSVVLIDEIDKAPRDFTNDILNEIERYEFSIKEKNYKVRLNENPNEPHDQRILVIMTSNSEKNLPDAFLRRCVFYNIEFPKQKEGFLLKIIKAQLESKEGETKEQKEHKEKNLDTIVEEFYNIRDNIAVRKKTATAEIVAFVKMLESKEMLIKPDLNIKEQFRENLSLIAKTKEDMDAIKKQLDKDLKA